MTSRPLMVLGCTSSAGKSLMVSALCRWFARQGVSVAPYKAQNMSNNARVVHGGEIGVAQWLQARAAMVAPTVDMNPVLLKPEADDRSQVIVHGKPRLDVSARPWRQRGEVLWPAMTESFDRLAAAHDLVVIEGAGSPAEINLPDMVNKGILAYADAAAMLVVDIDKGGAFAHLIGTWSLVDAETRRRMTGFVLNKFRGDAGLLEPGPSIVSERTSMANLGVLPMINHQLPDEEGATVRAAPGGDAPTVAIVRAPYGSNLDEWHLLPHAAHVRWAQTPADLIAADVIILPGSKHVAADMAWMRAQGLDAAIVAAADRGQSVLGVCGGAMMLGVDVIDDTGIEGATSGLGLLPIRTTMMVDKTVTAVDVHFPPMSGAWSGLSQRVASGYEIRHGVIDGSPVELAPSLWGRGNVLATTVHGLFEDPSVVQGLTGIRPPEVLETAFEQLADHLEAHLDRAAILAMVER